MRLIKNTLIAGGMIIISSFYLISFAQNIENKQTEEEYKLRRYEEIKKAKDKEYKKGVYNDDKKDYVKNWIGEDINYQKKAIKLKSDYRAWAEAKISRKEEVNFNDYEPLKRFTNVEKQIVLEYHNKLFSIYEKKKPANEKKSEKKRVKKNIINKPVDEIPDTQDSAIVIQPDNMPAAEDKNDNNYIAYLIPGIAGLFIIAGISGLIFKRLHKKKQTNKKTRLLSKSQKKKKGR